MKNEFHGAHINPEHSGPSFLKWLLITTLSLFILLIIVVVAAEYFNGRVPLASEEESNAVLEIEAIMIHEEYRE